MNFAFDAMDFASENMRSDMVPVVFMIEFQGKKGLIEMTREYTAFPVEDEVLI